MNDSEKPVVETNLIFFHDQFAKETDRASVILAASILDDLLKVALCNRLSINPQSQDSLFDGANSPIGTFSSRIDLAYRVGVTSTQFSRDLHIIRRIRNEFAHSISGCNFNEPRVQNRVLELIRSHRTLIKEEEHDAGNTPPANRRSFMWAVSWMCSSLESRASKIDRLEPAGNEFGYVMWLDYELPDLPHDPESM